jgi:cell division protein FtsB
MEKPRLNINKKQLAITGLLVVFVFLMMDLNGRISEMVRLSGDRDQIQTQVSQLEVTRDYMFTQIAYSTSEAAVEGWARLEGHLARPGDHPIVPLPPKEITPTAVVVVTPTVEVVENWQIWKALFLGQ